MLNPASHQIFQSAGTLTEEKYASKVYSHRSEHVTYLLFSHFLSKNLKIKSYKIIIVSVVSYEWETWSLTLREEHKTNSVRGESIGEHIWT
jgi:hypothetical protein